MAREDWTCPDCESNVPGDRETCPECGCHEFIPDMRSIDLQEVDINGEGKTKE